MPRTFIPQIIDIEASGFGRDSYPIEVGVAMSDGRKFCSLVLPETNWTHWDQQAEDAHRVSREVLLTHGKPAREVAKQLNELLSEATVYSDAWVVDKPWLNTLFEAAQVRMDFSISPLELILSEKQMQIWHETRAKIQEQRQVARHRACNDAGIIQETWVQTRKIAEG
jgi:hypothetical protein